MDTHKCDFHSPENVQNNLSFIGCSFVVCLRNAILDKPRFYVIHLCHSKLCVEVEHLVYEPSIVNTQRRSCVPFARCCGLSAYPDCMLRVSLLKYISYRIGSWPHESRVLVMMNHPEAHTVTRLQKFAILKQNLNMDDSLINFCNYFTAVYVPDTS